MKAIVFLPFICMSILLLGDGSHKKADYSVAEGPENLDQQLIAKAKQAKDFCGQHKMNNDWCILINLSIHSGKTRVYVWDFNQGKAVDSGLTSHGCGSNPWSGTASKEKPSFSNEDGSHCSSLGKYKIGKRGYSNWGINVNYLLHGLEASNSNALARQVVLHSWDVVSEKPVYPAGTPEGWGCPAISNGLMKRLDSKLKEADRPVLLWMFN